MLGIQRLNQQLQSLGIPIAGCSQTRIDYLPSATALQISTGNALLAGFDFTNRQPRPLVLILADIQALTGPQQAAIWTDISSGSPAKGLTSTGPNAGSIFLIYEIAVGFGLTGAALLAAKQIAVALYVADQVTYLVNPVFAPSVSIPGDV